MDHIVFLDHSSKELERVLDGSKDVIVRGATGRKLPHGRVTEGDILYFVRNNGEALIRAKATVLSVFCSDKLTPEESAQRYDQYQGRIQLNAKAQKRFRGKRYLTILEIGAIEALEPFGFDRTAFGNMDDWLPVGNINDVRL